MVKIRWIPVSRPGMTGMGYSDDGKRALEWREEGDGMTGSYLDDNLWIAGITPLFVPYFKM